MTKDVGALALENRDAEPNSSQPITLTLQQVLEGAKRAEERVARWPEWKLKLSPMTWPKSSPSPNARGEETG